MNTQNDSNCFVNFLYSIQKHQCKDLAQILSIDIKEQNINVQCENCKEEFNLPLGKMIHSTPDKFRWMFQSHEGRLFFISDIQNHLL